MGDAEVLIKFRADTSDVKSKTDQVSSGIENLTSKLTLANIAAQGFSYGMRLINSGLDDAITRVDTMNNFPRVMSNLGISAEESAEVIDDLSEKLQGLPTTLDDAAMSVQRITASTGDVKQAEKIFLAMNNAILAGGASTATQSAALEQMSQAFAKGKPDMMEWRTMMTAMPAQLTQVAKAMGYVDAAQLGEAVRADGGEEEFQRMIETMVQLNQTGYDTFPSLEEQARNATGGISTSVKNMKTAFVRGIADILMSIDKALEPMGGISGVLKSIGKVGEKAFKKIGDVLKVVIPKMIEIGKWIKKNKSWIEPLTAAIATFVVTFSTVKKIISIIKAVKVALLTLSTNPFALIVAGIAALVVGFIYLWNNCEEFRNFWIGLWNGIKKIVETVIKAIKKTIETIINVVMAVINKIKEICQPLIDFYEFLFLGIITLTTSLIDNIIKVVLPIVQWIWNKVLSPIINVFSNAFNTIWNTIKTIFNGIKITIQTVFNFIKDYIISPLIGFFDSIFQPIATGIETVFNGVKDTLDGIFNTIKEIIITPINWIIDALNTIIRALNKISIKVPKWVPKYGGKKWGFNISEIDHVQLATGTNYVPQDMPAYLHEGEAVVPKKFNPYANNFDMSTLGSFNNSRSNQTIIVNANFKQNSLGQTVRDIKTFSGGARNDYNYGM